MITVTLYYREQDPACEQAKKDLESLQVDYPHQLVLLNIDLDPGFQNPLASECPLFILDLMC